MRHRFIKKEIAKENKRVKLGVYDHVDSNTLLNDCIELSSQEAQSFENENTNELCSNFSESSQMETFSDYFDDEDDQIQSRESESSASFHSHEYAPGNAYTDNSEEDIDSDRSEISDGVNFVANIANLNENGVLLEIAALKKWVAK